MYPTLPPVHGSDSTPYSGGGHSGGRGTSGNFAHGGSAPYGAPAPRITKAPAKVRVLDFYRNLSNHKFEKKCSSFILQSDNVLNFIFSDLLTKLKCINSLIVFILFYFFTFINFISYFDINILILISFHLTYNKKTNYFY